jgi:DNA-binding NarL/FixJ family response regulator
MSSERDAGQISSERDPEPKPLRVVLADDSYLVREALARVLELAPGVQLVGAYEDSRTLLSAVESEQPDVVVTDIRMPPSGEAEGIRVAQELRRTAPDTGVVVLSQYAEPRYALDLLEGGSEGRAYLLKERVNDGRQLLEAIEAVARGDSVIEPKVVDGLVAARSRAEQSPLASLTPRERQILGEIAQGKSNAAIAESLVLTKRAVEKHINTILLKLDLPEAADVSRRVMATLIYLSESESEAALS